MNETTLTRADLADAMVRDLGLTRQDCAHLVERVLAHVCQALEQDGAVKLSGFGVFEVRAKSQRLGRNPKTGEPAVITPRRVMTFRASHILKARVARAYAARPVRAVADG